MKPTGDSRPRISGAVAWPKQWRVYGPLTGEEPLLPAEKLAVMPGDGLEINEQRYQARVVEAAANRIDFAEIYGGVEAYRTAYVFLPLTTEKDSVVTLGMGADYWLQAWLDGNVILETTETGNGLGGAPVAITNWLVNIKMTRGPHVLAARFISGSGGALLALGGPHELRERFRRRQDSPAPIRWRRPCVPSSVAIKGEHPAAQVHRTLYVPSPMPGTAPFLNTNYLGTGLRREETKAYLRNTDWADEKFRRVSEDNGRTWSDWQLDQAAWPTQNNMTKEELPFAIYYDPVSGRTVQAVFQRLIAGDLHQGMCGNVKCFDHGFWRHSADEGRTWSRQRLFTYEPGPDFDTADWSKSGYLKANQMYGGYRIAQRRDGELLYPVCLGVNHRNTDGSVERVGGVRCFIGRWNPAGGDYEWTLSAPVSVSRCVSGRGLMEPNVEELPDGRLFLEMRGSNEGGVAASGRGEAQKAGHRWISLSTDGGLTWGPVADMRYDDGEPFYSPSSMSLLVRSRKTGKLYWIGNICAEPPAGNAPRYPLYIAEVNEARPALKRETLTPIDTRDPLRDSTALQLSNFNVLENRETLELELYLTRLGEHPLSVGNKRANFTAGVYRYTLTIT